MPKLMDPATTETCNIGGSNYQFSMRKPSGSWEPFTRDRVHYIGD